MMADTEGDTIVQLKFHIIGRDRLHINEKGIETARKYAFGFIKLWIAS